MATYVIGDVHGSYRSLKHLFALLPFDRKRDRLWLTGDLVNRGPASGKVLRWAMAEHERLGKRFQLVLGNHDLHLIAVAEGVNPLRKHDRLSRLLEAADADRMVAWLRRRPFAVRRSNWLLVHAGLHPAWSIDEAEQRAKKLAKMFTTRRHRRLLLLKRAPSDLRSSLVRAREDLAYLTRVRLCRKSGKMSPFTGRPADAPRGTYPWHKLRSEDSDRTLVVYGHWAAQGLKLTKRSIGLDSGCAWGQRLTAIRLEDKALFSLPRQES